jgi:septation ring formation regulator EzrA
MIKTKVDDFLIEMITPKVKEIEEKFANSKPLSQDDINTLLLKSQYNHINHLDQKLDEVTNDVSSLKSDFKLLEANVNRRFEVFEQKLETFEQKFETFEQRFETFEQRFETFEQKIDATIQKALNKNMIMLVGAMGFFMAIFKIIDKF